jgi:hypothetical protein
METKSRELLPDKKQILDEVCKDYDTTAEEVIKMRRGKMNETHNVAIYMTGILRRDKLRKIRSAVRVIVAWMESLN